MVMQRKQTRVRNTSTIGRIPLPRMVEGVALHLRWPTSDLAAPPPGSGLRPVPGDGGLPFLGHALESMRLGPRFARARYEQYGPVQWSGMFGFRIVGVAGPDATQVVLTNKDKAFSQSGWEFFIGPFFNRGLMLLDFEEHLTHRRIMQEAFTRQRLAGYLDVLGPLVRERISLWGNGTRLLYPTLKDLTLDVAARVFMGLPHGVDNRQIKQAFIDTVHAGSALLRWDIPGGRWHAGLHGRRVLERYFRSRLPAKRAESGEDLFAALCHASTSDGARFSDDDVVNHMIFLMMAAHDTSTITATSTAYYLARHPEWQDRVRAESVALGDGPVDLAALDRLSTLDLVIKEALRLVAPVPVYVRKTLRDTDVLGYYLPRGTLVTVVPSVNHVVPECWSEPDRFDPLRFAEPRREDKSHRLAWIPFGGGAHKCIGMAFGTQEVKTLLHEMLLRYRWTVPPGYRAPWDWTSLPFPADGLPIALEPR